MLRTATILTFVLATAALTAGCSDDTTSTTTTPDPVLVTETFSGSVARNEAITHSFAATRAGDVTAQLTAVAPDGSVVSLALGILSLNSTCQLVVTKDDAVLNSSIVGVAQASGNLCVRVQAPSTLSGNISYEVKVSHY